jgi:glutamyl-tRNA synthetase
MEDTDQSRYVQGAEDFIYRTLKMAGLTHDEGPDVGGGCGPYRQSERKHIYIRYAEQLVKNGDAYYCFCKKEDSDDDNSDEPAPFARYDRKCYRLTQQETESKIANGEPYCVRQLIPPGATSFNDVVYGDITIQNEEIEDQVLLKSDGMPTYNFANVVDDHLMGITHVLRGCEYLTSTPKYNLLYAAFGWQPPVYIHLPLILDASGHKFSKRDGSASFANLLDMGFLPEAVVNYVALLGWSPSDNREKFSLAELIREFDERRISKSPAVFDINKLTWLNGEYWKAMDPDEFRRHAMPVLRDCVKTPGIDLATVAAMVQTRISFLEDIPAMVSFIDNMPDYDKKLFEHKKMKTTAENSLTTLTHTFELLNTAQDRNFSVEHMHDTLLELAATLGVKNGVVLWPVRTALSGQPTSPCGAAELCALLGRDETLRRIKIGTDKLKT